MSLWNSIVSLLASAFIFLGFVPSAPTVPQPIQDNVTHVVQHTVTAASTTLVANSSQPIQPSYCKDTPQTCAHGHHAYPSYDQGKGCVENHCVADSCPAIPPTDCGIPSHPTTVFDSNNCPVLECNGNGQ